MLVINGSPQQNGNTAALANSINHNPAYANGKRFLTAPKTESSIRSIGMSDTLAEIFKEQRS